MYNATWTQDGDTHVIESPAHMIRKLSDAVTSGLRITWTFDGIAVDIVNVGLLPDDLSGAFAADVPSARHQAPFWHYDGRSIPVLVINDEGYGLLADLNLMQHENYTMQIENYRCKIMSKHLMDRKVVYGVHPEVLRVAVYNYKLCHRDTAIVVNERAMRALLCERTNLAANLVANHLFLAGNINHLKQTIPIDQRPLLYDQVEFAKLLSICGALCDDATSVRIMRTSSKMRKVLQKLLSNGHDGERVTLGNKVDGLLRWSNETFTLQLLHSSGKCDSFDGIKGAIETDFELYTNKVHQFIQKHGSAIQSNGYCDARVMYTFVDGSFVAEYDEIVMLFPPVVSKGLDYADLYDSLQKNEDGTHDLLLVNDAVATAGDEEYHAVLYGGLMGPESESKAGLVEKVTSDLDSEVDRLTMQFVMKHHPDLLNRLGDAAYMAEVKKATDKYRQEATSEAHSHIYSKCEQVRIAERTYRAAKRKYDEANADLDKTWRDFKRMA